MGTSRRPAAAASWPRQRATTPPTATATRHQQPQHMSGSMPLAAVGSGPRACLCFALVLALLLACSVVPTAQASCVARTADDCAATSGCRWTVSGCVPASIPGSSRPAPEDVCQRNGLSSTSSYWGGVLACGGRKRRLQSASDIAVPTFTPLQTSALPTPDPTALLNAGSAEAFAAANGSPNANATAVATTASVGPGAAMNEGLALQGPGRRLLRGLWG